MTLKKKERKIIENKNPYAQRASTQYALGPVGRECQPWWRQLATVNYQSPSPGNTHSPLCNYG